MKTLKSMFLGLALVVVGSIVWASVATAAGGPAAVIKNDGLCGMPGSDANGNIIFGGVGEVTTDVTNGNKEMIKCMGAGIENDSGRGQNWNGFGCGTFSGFTTDSHATVSASGVGTMTCTVHF